MVRPHRRGVLISTAWTDLSVESGTASLAAQVSGESTSTPILLVPGATQSRDVWSDDFCSALVAAGLRVIRYDPRDTGQSTCSAVGRPDYTDADLIADVIAVLDAADVGQAILLGLSMGGGIVQAVAAAHPERALGLVLASTTPADGRDRQLPGPAPEVLATVEAAEPEPDWADLDAVVAWTVDAERAYAGNDYPETATLRTSTKLTWRRSPSMASAVNHLQVAGQSGPVDLDPALGLPTVVVHGSADPLFPLPHGEALAALFDARLLVLDGVGHQVPPRPTWPEVVEAVVKLGPTSL